jgi:hypothetical protein
MDASDRSLPPLLAALHRLKFDYAGGKGIDFRPFAQFKSADESRAWIVGWTRNEALDAAEYRMFGKDGTGGMAAFWLVRPDAPVLAQPIVFFGSEGEVGVVAANFSDYLWLLAAGYGPCEVVGEVLARRKANARFTAFAREHAASSEKSATDVLRIARAEFPDFAAKFAALCR